MEAAAQPPAPPEAYAVKYSLGRAWACSIASFGIWTIWWFYVHRKRLDAELGEGRDDAALHTLGFFVPVLNYFILFWLWRDISRMRVGVGLPEFPAGAYTVGAVFFAPVLYSFVLVKLNEFWDVRTQGLATDAGFTTGEKVTIGVGVALFALYVLLIIVAIVVAIAAGS